MESSESVRELFKDYGKLIDNSIKGILSTQFGLPIYDHMSYFMGFLDDQLLPTTSYGGKRFRSGLCLMLADWYGHKEEGMSVATSIELFHNFTLIHDDIVDEDELRRGRPTVWKLFGTDHAINSGDGQLIVALQAIVNSKTLSPEQKMTLQSFLLQQYLQVVEGQYLDFIYTKKDIGDAQVAELNYFEMITRKTAALVATATKSVGLIAKLPTDETERLFSFGENLGIAYQICDDTMSIWGSTEVSGKRVCGDIIEKKKTLPILYALQKLNQADASVLTKFYNNTEKLTLADAEQVVKLIDSVETYEAMMTYINQYATTAKEAVGMLQISQDQKDILYIIIDMLLPKIKSL